MLFRADHISKRYPGEKKEALRSLSFEVEEGKTLGLFGMSGCGKSTVAQIVSGIFMQTGGKIFFHDREIRYPFWGEERRRIQILFQHPEVTFNPKVRLIDSMKEPYYFFHLNYKREHLLSFLEQFGIYEEHIQRYPRELSGGELQRLALARVMLAEPELLVLDEPTSMLDVISQAQMIRMLMQVQKEKGLAYLFITHDRKLCEIFCDDIISMDYDSVGEIGDK